MSLIKFLNKKPIFYTKLDYERFPLIYNTIKSKINLSPCIHVVGTNGKGSTGRFLALILQSNGLKVGHYTSPHIMNFNERIWLNGKDLDLDSLELSHKKLQNILTKEQSKKLSFFEYMTLLAAVSFEDCDEIIMEAGLGGEYDATNVFDKKLSIVTKIGFDHEKFLGNKIEEIAKTKINSIKTMTLLARQKENEVVEIAKQIANKKGVCLYRVVEIIDDLSKNEIKKYVKKYDYSKMLEENLQTAVMACKILNYKNNLSILPKLDLQGRLQKLEENLFIDVGHNPLGAQEIASNFDEKSIILIFNSFEDKDFKQILNFFSNKVKEIQLLPMDGKGRKTNLNLIIEEIKKLNIPYKMFEKKIKKEEKYLVFGSFFVVEEFLKWYYER